MLSHGPSEASTGGGGKRPRTAPTTGTGSRRGLSARTLAAGSTAVDSGIKLIAVGRLRSPPMPFVYRDGVRLHYTADGSGFPIVLHTGGAGDLRMWAAAGYVTGLTGYHRIRIDHRGRGASDKPHELELHRIEAYVADVLAVLDELHVGHCAFWGYSAGALVGYALAAAHPARVAALVATGSPGPRDLSSPPEREAASRLAASLRAEGMRALVDPLRHAEPEDVPDWLIQNLLETNPEMLALTELAWSSWGGPWGAFSRIRAPTLLLVGQREDPHGDALRAARALPRGRAVVLPGVGHLGAFARSDLALPIVTGFLREVLSRGPPGGAY